MKTLYLLIILLVGGFAFWKYNEIQKLDPTVEDGTFRHTVVKGDTLTSLAKKHNTTVASIKKHNKLKNDTILLGTSLSIHPGDSPLASNATRSTTPRTLLDQVPPQRKTTSKPKAVKNSPPKAKVIELPKKTQVKPKALTKRNLPKSTVMESSTIAIDIDARNQVYLKNSAGKFVPAGSIIYGSDADSSGMEVKTITYRDLKGKETTLTGYSDPQSVIRLALKKK